jgi:predicted small secreted protein
MKKKTCLMVIAILIAGLIMAGCEMGGGYGSQRY